MFFHFFCQTFSVFAVFDNVIFNVLRLFEYLSIQIAFGLVCIIIRTCNFNLRFLYYVSLQLL